MNEAAAAIVASLIAAFSALWIGWLHHEATQAQNRIAAFERRFSVFKRSYDALDQAFKRPADIETSISALQATAQEAHFLFPAGVSEYLSTALFNLIDSTAGDDVIDGTSEESRITKRAARKQIIRHRDGLREVFDKHMRL